MTGTCFANTGNTVTCLDVDEQKIDQLRRGRCPIYEPGLSDMIARNIARGRLSFTTDKSEAYADAEVIFICVGTPLDDGGSADVRAVIEVAADIADALDEGAGCSPVLVVIKSTVPVGTT